MADRGELRAQAIELSGGICEWIGCNARGEELAHIEPSGMGGRPSMDRLDNVAWLCRHHHNILDGRTITAGAYREIRRLVAFVVRAQRRRIGWTPDGAPGSS